MVKRTKSEFLTEVSTQFPNNNSNLITPARLRSVTGTDLTDSTAFIGTVSENQIPMLDDTGTLNTSSLSETTTNIVSTKTIQVPPESIVLGSDGSRISSAGHEVAVQTTDQIDGFIIRGEFNDSGSLTFARSLLAARADIDIQLVKSDNSDAAPFSFDYTTTGRRHTKELIIESPDTGTLGYTIKEGSSSGPVIRTGSFAVTADTETRVTLDEPICYEAGVTLNVAITGVRLKGTGTGANFQPFLKINAWNSTVDEIFTDNNGNEKVEDIMSTVLVQGSGINIVHDDNANTITISATGATFDQPRLTNLAIDIASRVDLNTDLNTARTITFDVMHQANIQGDLTLEVTTGDNKTISSPFVDGENTKAVTLSGIDTSSQGTVTFKLTGTDTQSNTFESNTVSIEVRDLTADEYFYHGLSDSNNPASVDLSTLGQEQVTGSGQVFTISSGTATAGQYLIFLVPADHTISSIINTGTNINEFPSFTRTDDVRIINSVNYDSYVLGSLVAGFNANYRVALA